MNPLLSTFALSSIAIACSCWLAARAARSLPSFIGAPGAQTRMLIAGEAGPVVVLDTFGAEPLETWGTIQWRCSQFSQVVTYDHRGIGGSDPGPKPRDARQIATELHTTLHAAGIPPPYILVGCSFGGPYVRVFADLFPREVSGMVLIDPSQEEFFHWLKAHRPDVNRISPTDVAAENEFASTWASLEQARAARIPPVPLTLITAMKPIAGMDPRLAPQWLRAHQNWLRQIPGAQHIVTERSDHGIIWEEPDLVVKTIQEMVNRVK